jgi:ELWxxDGT repeat protein
LGRSAHRSTLAEYQGKIFFGVGLDGTNQRELWSFDGERARLVSDGFVGQSATDIDEFTVFRDSLYFTADNGVDGVELYRYDNDGLRQVADLQPGPGGSNPSGLMVHDDRLFFSAKQGDSFNTLWSYDGRNAQQVAGFANPSASVVTGGSFRGDFYFGADDGVSGMELWKYDGAQVSQIADVNLGGGGSFPRGFVAVGDNLYFKAISAEIGAELWKYDGNTVTLVQDTYPGPLSSDPRNLTEFQGELFFSANAYGRRELWRYDGANIQQLASGGGPLRLGNELFVFRGRREGTVEFTDLWQVDGRSASFFKSLVPSAGPFELLDGELYFTCTCDSGELMKVAVAGDADRDGRVALSDFLTLAENFGARGEWHHGDFNLDGSVAFEDFVLQAENYGDPPLRTTLVPESANAAPILLVMAILGGRRKRRHQQDVT